MAEVKKNEEASGSSKVGYSLEAVGGGAPGRGLTMSIPGEGPNGSRLSVKDVYAFSLGWGVKYDLREWFRLTGYGEGTFTRSFASGPTESQWSVDFKGKLCGHVTWGKLTALKTADIGVLEPAACVAIGTGGGTLGKANYYGHAEAGIGATVLRAGFFNFDILVNGLGRTDGTTMNSVFSVMRIYY